MDNTQPIYLDYASHTPPCPAAIEAFLRGEEAFTGNANARHRLGAVAGAEYSRVTQGIAALLGASAPEENAGEIIYTTGASEGNALAIGGITTAYRHKGRHIIATPLAHPSEGGAISALAEEGYEISHVRLRENGLIDLAHLATLIRSDTILFCLSAVDSELGTVQPLEAVVKTIAPFENCHLHIDGAQAMGKIPMPPFGEMGRATLCGSAHKFYGVGGSGVLVKHPKIILDTPRHEGGTPALGLACACYAALEEGIREMDTRYACVTALRNRLEAALERYPLVRVNSPAPPVGSPYILNLSVAGVRGTAFRDALNARGVCVSVKSACATDASPSRGVLAVSDKVNALSAWRVSLSHLTTTREIEEFLRIFDICYRELTSQ